MIEQKEFEVIKKFVIKHFKYFKEPFIINFYYQFGYQNLFSKTLSEKNLSTISQITNNYELIINENSNSPLLYNSKGELTPLGHKYNRFFKVVNILEHSKKYGYFNVNDNSPYIDLNFEIIDAGFGFMLPELVHEQILKEILSYDKIEYLKWILSNYFNLNTNFNLFKQGLDFDNSKMPKFVDKEEKELITSLIDKLI